MPSEFLVPLLHGLLILSALPSAFAGATPLDVGDRKQLFIDDLFFETSENIMLRVQPAAKTGERTLESDKPWESASLNWFSVLEDRERFSMWYECYDVEGWPTEDDTSFCYAESTDAIHWNKPSLGLFTYHGSTDNNILFRQIPVGGTHSRVHGSQVFLDAAAPPAERYKAVSQGIFHPVTPPHRVMGLYSEDGLHWNAWPEPICDIFADSQYSAFWEAASAHYVLYGRVSGRGRAIGRAESSALRHFDPLELVLEAGAESPPESDLYNPAVLKYAYADKAYFMFTSLYQHTADTLDIRLAVSRDGIHWSWPEAQQPFVALGAPGSFDSGSLYLGQGLVRRNNELWQYYSGSPLKHNEAELDALLKPGNQRVFSRIVSRLDGFVAVEAGEAAGSFRTPPLSFQGDRLLVNYRASAGGELRIALTDEAGNPLAGHTVEDCEPLSGDNAASEVRWSGGSDLGGIPHENIRMTIQMCNVRLFAFQFVSPPGGASSR